MKTKKWVVAGVTAGILAGAGAGFALNLPGGASASPSHSVTAPADDSGRIAARLTEVLQPLVDAGTITAADLTAVVDALSAPPANPPMAGGHEGPGGHRGPGGHEGRGPRGEGVAKAAEVIGVTVEELESALRSGQSIAQVAESKGMSANSVIDALVADATVKLRERITDMVNEARPAPPAEPGSNPGN